ncbi:hypothetical protein F183_A20210 [Bryobacterales bacterium F-183]|nr:hypothetical protein F183_A20210 [Bryobacterales bacterium F-183]
MALTLQLEPEVERELTCQAQARGLSVEAFASRVLEERVRNGHPARAVSLVEASYFVRGLLTDEEADTLFARSKDEGRPVSFE